MVIKTEAFNKQFMTDLTTHMYFNHKDRRNPKILGSYLTKAYGEVITDIDVRVYVHDMPFAQMNYIFKSILRKPMFLFSYLWLGNTTDIKVPWSDYDVFKCEFDLVNLKSWYDDLTSKNIINSEDLHYIKDALFTGSISPLGVANVADLIEKYTNLYWLPLDIINGYKDVRGIRYNFETIFLNTVCVIRFFYIYMNEFVPVDFAIRNDNHSFIRLMETSKYFKGTRWHKMIKLFKHDLDPAFLASYYEINKHLERHIALSYLIAHYKMASKYGGYIPQNIMQNITTYISMKANELRIGVDNINDIDDAVNKHITEICKEAVPFFIEHSAQRKLEHFILYSKTLDCSIAVLNHDIERRKISGSDCPLFALQTEDYKKVYDICNRFKLSYQTFNRCLTEMEPRLQQSVKNILSSLFDNNLSIRDANGKLLLMDGEIIKGEFDVKHLKDLQLFGLLSYKNDFI